MSDTRELWEWLKRGHYILTRVASAQTLDEIQDRLSLARNFLGSTEAQAHLASLDAEAAEGEQIALAAGLPKLPGDAVSLPPVPDAVSAITVFKGYDDRSPTDREIADYVIDLCRVAISRGRHCRTLHAALTASEKARVEAVEATWIKASERVTRAVNSLVNTPVPQPDGGWLDPPEWIDDAVLHLFSEAARQERDAAQARFTEAMGHIANQADVIISLTRGRDAVVESQVRAILEQAQVDGVDLSRTAAKPQPAQQQCDGSGILERADTGTGFEAVLRCPICHACQPGRFCGGTGRLTDYSRSDQFPVFPPCPPTGCADQACPNRKEG